MTYLRKPMSKKLRFEVFKRDGFTCSYCGASSPDAELHVDHIIPVSKGGSNDMENLATACADCNAGKGANFHDPVMAELHRLRGENEKLSDQVLVMQLKEKYFQEMAYHEAESLLHEHFRFDVTEATVNSLALHVWKLGSHKVGSYFHIAKYDLGDACDEDVFAYAMEEIGDDSADFDNQWG